jgi:aminoglycoside/choline kinase family phosphotransferase
MPKKGVIAAVQLQEDVLSERKRQLDAWVSSCLGEPLNGETASSDASFRRYFRYTQGGRSVIAMDAPPEREDCRPFVKVARRLAEAGIHVPRILAEDLLQGFLLLSDLGTSTWLSSLDETNADDFFDAALNVLVNLQQVDNADLPTYDPALIARELALFPDWYLAREKKRAFTTVEQVDWQELCDLLTNTMLSQPRVFVHRDFMPRNLMLSNPNPGVLDFQDAVAGPIAYDPVCLFRDAFISWPEERVSGWLVSYHRKARAAGLPVPGVFAEFKRWVDFTGVQRHLKVIGIFARICHRDGKPAYLNDVPRFFTYLRTQAEGYAELAPLKRLLESIQ